jgi:hypothetical protein
VAVGVCTWLAEGSSGGVRVLAALIGLAVGLLIMLLVAWALSAEEAPPAVVPVAPSPVAVPVAEPVAPEAPAPLAAPAPDLQARLEEGHALAREAPTGSQVDDWVERTRSHLAQHRPGVLGYFAALGSRSYPDDAARLAAHLARLETIVRDMA